MAANIRCIMRAKAPYGQGITKMKVKLTPEQSSTPSLMPETNSVYLSRPTEGTGELMKLIGGTVAWNQMATVYTGTRAGVTVADGGNGVVELSGTTSATYFATHTAQTFTQNHVYFIRLIVDANPNSVAFNFLPYNLSSDFGINQNGGEKIAKWTSASKNSSIGFGTIANGVSTNGIKLRYVLIDLTQMFGSTLADYVYSLEQATAGSGIAWLKSYGFFTEDYIAYSAPTLQSVEASAHVTRGKNLFDGSQVSTTHTSNWDVTWSDNTLTIEHKNSYTTGVPTFPLSVPSGDYVLSYASTTKMGKISLYRNGSWVNTLNNGTTFTVNEADTNEVCFSADVGSPVTTVNIQIESGTTATEYSPHHAPTTYPLDSDLVLRGIPKLNNGSLYYDGDTYEWDGTVTRNYGTRAYQAGDESLTDAITDGTNTVYKLNIPTTESADPFTAVQTVEDGGTEEFVTTNNVPVGVVGRFANAVPMEGVDSFTVTANDGTSHTYPVTLSEEIYRGYVDMLTGEAVSDMASIAEYNGETISEPWLSSLDVYSAGATPTNGAQVVYPITPEEVTATITGDPTELAGVVSATSTEGTVEWSELSEIGIKCIMKRKNPFQ